MTVAAKEMVRGADNYEQSAAGEEISVVVMARKLATVTVMTMLTAMTKMPMLMTVHQ
jgi:hypothetical protein